MKPEEFEMFLRSTLPEIGYRWKPLRRRNIRRKIQRRMDSLRLRDADAYRSLVLADPEERDILESLLKVTISRFFRNAALWEELGKLLRKDPGAGGDGGISAWSAGCAGGEEAYSLAMLLASMEENGYINPSWRVMGTDTHETSLLRAEEAVYQWGSVREIPGPMRERWFVRDGDDWILSEELRGRVLLSRQDLLVDPPPGRFNLVLLRNSILTYNTERIRREVLSRIHGCLDPPGLLVIGRTEHLPEGVGFEMVSKCIYRKLEIRD